MIGVVREREKREGEMYRRRFSDRALQGKSSFYEVSFRKFERASFHDGCAIRLLRVSNVSLWRTGTIFW